MVLNSGMTGSVGTVHEGLASCHLRLGTEAPLCRFSSLTFGVVLLYSTACSTTQR